MALLRFFAWICAVCALPAEKKMAHRPSPSARAPYLGSLSSAASKAGMSTGCDEARFHAKPKHERITRVLPNWPTPESAVPPMPKAMNEKKSRTAAVLPLVSST